MTITPDFHAGRKLLGKLWKERLVWNGFTSTPTPRASNKL